MKKVDKQMRIPFTRLPWGNKLETRNQHDPPPPTRSIAVWHQHTIRPAFNRSRVSVCQHRPAALRDLIS
jgi:hypothetical protein